MRGEPREPLLWVGLELLAAATLLVMGGVILEVVSPGFLEHLLQALLRPNLRDARLRVALLVAASLVFVFAVVSAAGLLWVRLRNR